MPTTGTLRRGLFDVEAERPSASCLSVVHVQRGQLHELSTLGLATGMRGRGRPTIKMRRVARAHEIGPFAIIELTERLDEAPAIASEGLLELHDDVAMPAVRRSGERGTRETLAMHATSGRGRAMRPWDLSSYECRRA